MYLYRWTEIPVETLSETVTRQVLHSEAMTVSRLRLARGAKVPRHSHLNEQISSVESGELRFRFDSGDAVIVRAGEMLQIPPNLPHEVEALEDSVALDLFSPPREDWIRGDDAYLRGR